MANLPKLPITFRILQAREIGNKLPDGDRFARGVFLAEPIKASGMIPVCMSNHPRSDYNVFGIRSVLGQNLHHCICIGIGRHSSVNQQKFPVGKTNGITHISGSGIHAEIARGATESASGHKKTRCTASAAVRQLNRGIPQRLGDQAKVTVAGGKIDVKKSVPF